MSRRKAHRIALIHPGYSGLDLFDLTGRSHLPPLGVLYLAACLEKEGHEVLVFDMNLSEHRKRVLSEVCDFSPQLVGIGTLAASRDSCFEWAQLLRRKMGDRTKIIAGGADATVQPDPYLESSVFDAVLIGEAEETLTTLVENLPKITATKGVLVPGEAKQDLPAKQDPDAVPFPARHLLPLKQYRGGPAYKKRRYSTSIFTHRGCPYNCRFCEKGVHEGPMRLRSAPSILEEVRQIGRDHDIHDLRFIDDVVMANPTVLREMIEGIRRRDLRFDWMCCGRTDLMDVELLRLMKQAGCYRIELGLESGDDQVLKRINKGTTTRQAIEAVRHAHDAGIEVIANFILGFPGESEELMLKTVEFSRRVAPDYAIYFLFQPFTGAPISRELNLPWDSEQPEGRGETGQYLVPTSHVEKIIYRAYRRFYFNPNTIWRRLRALKSGWILLDLAIMAVAHLFQRKSRPVQTPTREIGC